jgi:hypothetical protein
VALGGVALVVVAFAWVTLSNLTWFLFFPLLAVSFVPVFGLARRQFARDGRAGTTPGMPALAALIAAMPFALALVAPADLVNRLSLAQAAPVMARVLKVERKEDGYGRGTRKFQYYTLKLEEAGRDIVLRGPEERPRFGSGETVSICGYRGLLGVPVYGLPPCTQTRILQ